MTVHGYVCGPVVYTYPDNAGAAWTDIILILRAPNNHIESGIKPTLHFVEKNLF